MVAFLPGMPRLDLPPELILALFVAPVLLDAAHDASLRDLRENWAPILSLVMVAVGLTTVAVAVAARFFIPEMPWAAAIALGCAVGASRRGGGPGRAAPGGAASPHPQHPRR